MTELKLTLSNIVIAPWRNVDGTRSKTLPLLPRRFEGKPWFLLSSPSAPAFREVSAFCVGIALASTIIRTLREDQFTEALAQEIQEAIRSLNEPDILSAFNLTLNTFPPARNLALA